MYTQLHVFSIRPELLVSAFAFLRSVTGVYMCKLYPPLSFITLGLPG